MLMKPRLVLVTGASGAVGSQVVQLLHSDGYSVRTFSNSAPKGNMFPKHVEALIGDVTDQSAVQAVMQGVDVVVHLAALLHIVNPPLELREKYERVNVDGTATVVDAAIKAGVKCVELSSTIAVYGPSDGQVLDEDSATHPDTYYGQTKLAAEKIVLDARRADGQPMGTVLRFGAVYGARVKGNYRRLARALARGRFVPVGDGRNRRTLVYDRDVARAAVLAMQHPAAAGRVYNVSDGQFHPLNDIIAAICEALGRTPPRFALPLGPVRFAAGMLEDAARLVGRQSPIGRTTIDKYTEDVAADSRRIQAELGFVPQFDLKAGWQETIREMRQSGDL